MTTNRTEVVAGLTLLAFSIFAWNQAAGIRGAAAMFPRFIIVVLGIFSLIYLARSIFNGRPNETVFKSVPIFVTILIASIVYVQAVVAVGFVTSTVIFVPLISWIIGFRRKMYMAVTTVIYVMSMYFVFEVVFKRPMPDDILIQLVGRLF